MAYTLWLHSSCPWPKWHIDLQITSKKLIVKATRPEEVTKRTCVEYEQDEVQNWALGNTLDDPYRIWSTPSVFTFPMLTHWYLFIRYDSIHLLTVPLMPNLFSSHLRKSSWSMVSNTANWPNSMRQVISCFSMALRMSACTLSTDVSVLKCCQYADLLDSIRLFSLAYTTMFDADHLSINFKMKLRFNTGLKFLSSRSRFAFLSGGFIRDSFVLSGLSPSWSDWLTMAVMKSMTDGSISLRRVVGIGSLPQLLLCEAFKIFFTWVDDSWSNSLNSVVHSAT